MRPLWYALAMAKPLSFVALLSVAVLLGASAALPSRALPSSPDEPYCCLCADCAGAGCVLVDVMALTADAGHACTASCPMDCHGSVLVEGACAEHTAAECPVTERAPALSPWAVALCVAALGVYGVRRVRRS